MQTFSGTTFNGVYFEVFKSCNEIRNEKICRDISSRGSRPSQILQISDNATEFDIQSEDINASVKPTYDTDIKLDHTADVSDITFDRDSDLESDRIYDFGTDEDEDNGVYIERNSTNMDLPDVKVIEFSHSEYVSLGFFYEPVVSPGMWHHMCFTYNDTNDQVIKHDF